MRFPMRGLITALVVGSLTLTAACGGSSEGDQDAGATTLTVGATAEPPTLDLTTTPAAAIPQALLCNLYEGLVKLDGDGEIVPLLAQSWTVSPDRLTYTFALEPDAVFSNGDPVTADDVAFSINRVIAPESTHPFKAQLASVQSVTAPDEHTAVVTLAQPSNNWLFYMTSSVGIVFDQKAIETIATDPVGSGPFRFDSWNRGTSLTLVANDEYWGKKPALTEVEFRYFSDPNAMNNALFAGDIDLISNVQAPEALAQPQFQDETQFAITDGTTNGEVVLAMNNSTGPLKDKLVRQAINYAIDREALVKTVWAGYGTLIGSMVPPTDPWYEDLSDTYPYDPDQAKALLAQAGYADGLTQQMKLPTLPYATGAGQFIASALKDVGVDAQVSQLEFPSRWLDVVFTQGDYDLSIVAHVEPRDIEKYGDPAYYWHYDNPQIATWLREADAGTPEQQVETMKKVAKQLADDAASDWLFLLPNLVVAKKGITGYPENAVSLSFDVTAVTKG